MKHKFVSLLFLIVFSACPAGPKKQSDAKQPDAYINPKEYPHGDGEKK